MSQTIYETPKPTYDALKDYAKGLVYPWDTKLIDRAFELAALGHRHQLRQSGEPYIYHPLAVARIVAGLQCDRNTFIAAILHDVAEDTDIGLDQIKDEFGREVASIVDTVTQIPKSTGDALLSPEQSSSETLRKTLVGIAKDLRVAYIKLADRLHNLMTLGGRPPDKRARTIEETINYFGPLARELGIASLHNQLMKWALRYGGAAEYDWITNLATDKQEEHHSTTKKIWRKLDTRLRQMGIDATPIEIPFELILMNQLEHEFWLGLGTDELISPFRTVETLPSVTQLILLFNTTISRYSALEAVHSLGSVLYNQFGDWVTYPQPNGYSAIHTSVWVRLESDQLVEFRLQTNREYKLSQLGPLFELCRSVDYQEAYQKTPQASTLNKIIEIDKTADNTRKLLEYIQREALKPKIRVFTVSSSSEHATIPSGATVLDLAYLLIPSRGYQCTGDFVNGNSREIQHVLHDGDIVKVIMNSEITSPDSSWRFGREFNMPSTKYTIEKLK